MATYAYRPEALAARGCCAWCADPCGRERFEFRGWLFCSLYCVGACLERHFHLSARQAGEVLRQLGA